MLHVFTLSGELVDVRQISFWGWPAGFYSFPLLTVSPQLTTIDKNGNFGALTRTLFMS